LQLSEPLQSKIGKEGIKVFLVHWTVSVDADYELILFNFGNDRRPTLFFLHVEIMLDRSRSWNNLDKTIEILFMYQEPARFHLSGITEEYQ
jgi:hypothetical protein